MQMKRYILPTLTGLTVALSLNAQAVDPVLMTIDSKPVHVSEFEYLYNKNNAQQQQPQTLDQYLDMFITYKLKVADAEAAGIENTPEFQNEFQTFRRDLSKPYLRDGAVEDSLVNLSYSHRLNDLYVSHIMFPMDEKGKAQADSVRAQIIAGTISFEDAAKKFSIDGYSASRGGLMGIVMPDRYPWAFEEASYDTPLHQISPVVNSGMGYHIIRPESKRPAAGEVNASHILLLTRGLDQKSAEAQKVKIDSIYDVILAGGDFAELARTYSQDPGSAARGGNLGYFSRGQMVAEFDSTAFALADGEVSRPITTAFGYHIVRRNAHRDVEPLEKVRPEILKAMENDRRGQLPELAVTDRVIQTLNGQVNEATMQQVEAAIASEGNVYNANVAAKLAALDLEAASFADHSIPLSEILEIVIPDGQNDGQRSAQIIRNAAYNRMVEKAMDYQRDALEMVNEDFRNLVNEYRDGILLYEISNRNVWGRASKDTEGLQNFFNNHIDRYTWTEPRYKATVIFATNDSILNEAMAYAETVTADEPTEFATEMRKKFGRNVKIERVVAAKGENKITDYLGFDGPRPERGANNRWPAYAAFRSKLIMQAEEPADVRGAAVTDYQNELEKEWVANLRKHHKVKVNQKVFKALKAKAK